MKLIKKTKMFAQQNLLDMEASGWNRTGVRIAIIGSRDFDDYQFLHDSVLKVFKIEGIDSIVSGGARGADSLAERFASELNVPMKVFHAEWDIYGKTAGLIRNTKIIEASDVVFAFCVNHSSGTMDSVKKARRLGKELHLFEFNSTTE